MKHEANGVIEHPNLERKTDYLFRISMKSLIRDNEGRVLVVKETGRTWWDLPGGGMDHEEGIRGAIARELSEEVNLIGGFTYKIIANEEPAFLEHSKIWQVRLIFEVKPDNMTFSAGEDGDEIAFMNPDVFRDSESHTERLVYEYSQLS